jgi:ADP-heptose:LPS heptosyltransferase
VPYNFYLPIGNLGKFFRSALEDFKNQPKKFLQDDKDLTKKYKSNFDPNKKYICGLSWKSQNKALSNPKSLSLEKIIPILKLKNITFVDLQYGDTEDDKKRIEEKYGIKIESINGLDKFNNIDGLASLISACDFVLTTSNITVHLAGALGKETYLLLPYSFGKIWYWHEGEGQSLWYPSVEMHSQFNKSDWETPISEVLKEINKKYHD